jgi:hypothetical protein
VFDGKGTSEKAQLTHRGHKITFESLFPDPGRHFLTRKSPRFFLNRFYFCAQIKIHGQHPLSYYYLFIELLAWPIPAVKSIQILLSCTG